MKKFILSLASMLITLSLSAELTLDGCLKAAEENYPLIKKYELIDRTQTLNLSDINKQWLPGATVYAQGTIQNAVAEYPSALRQVMTQFGQEIKGLGKLQYKVGLDLQQTIWDGGTSKAKREITRADSEEAANRLRVNLYQIRERVMSLYFGLLLVDEQIKQQEQAISLLEANCRKLTNMERDGVAMKSDVNNIEAQILTARQQLTQAQSARQSYAKVLSLYIGEEVGTQTLTKPSDSMPATLTSNRPEISLFDSQMAANNAKLTEVKASLMPRISAFAQSFYGYPGFKNIEAMINRNPSFNIIAGVKVAWTLAPVYTNRNMKAKIAMANDGIEIDREVFLFNSSLQSASQSEEINAMRRMMADDSKIISLREAVRQSAESQLDNGVIDTVALLSKINDETQARLTADYHEIKLLQSIYQLKYTLNQ